MKTTSTPQGIHSDEQVAAQELELKGLLSRVMEAPLDPVLQRMGRIDARLDELEEMCRESRDLAHGVHADIAEQKSVIDRSLRNVQKSGEELRSALQDGLSGLGASIGGSVSGVAGQLGQVHQLQQSQDGTLKAFSASFGAIDDELKRAGSRIDAVIPAQQGSAQQLKDELLQSHAQHGDRLDRLQQAFQRKFTLLAVACGFSVVANIVLLVAFLR
jgi:chromosome segregation ATPase